MRITLTVIDGPHQGQEFSFARHDTFLVGRSKHAHFQLPFKDKYFSRVHFMVEVNPPQCRIIDMGSHNGTYVNGTRLLSTDLQDGDQIRAGHTILKLAVHPEAGDAAVATAQTPRVQEIPGYKLMGELGRGGMGIVYQATRLADNAQVAIKTIAPPLTGTRAQFDLFLEDSRILAELDHPHIVHFQEQGLAGGLLYFVMEYVAGKDTGTLLKKDGLFAIQRALALICQVLQGLEYAHGKKFIHRDIKPANVLVADLAGQETAKLADYGLARLYQAAQFSGLTMIVDVGGSAGFLPPEVITNFRGAEPQSDQYAAAATLYTMLTGQFVFDLPSEIHRQFSVILQAQPVPIQQRRADVSSELATVIHKALARNPAQRFADVGAFCKALQKTVT